MELFKRYMAASSMGVVALVCVLVGLLGVTVLRPPTHQVSSVESATDLIMTRGKTLVGIALDRIPGAGSIVIDHHLKSP